MSMQTTMFSGLVTAVREVFSDMRSEINHMIYEQLDQRQIQYQKGFDFYNLMQNIVRKSGATEDMQEEILQDIVVHMFARVDQKSIFDLYTPGQATTFERWFYTAVYRRVLNAIERLQRERRERPSSGQPGDEGEDSGSVMDRAPAKGEGGATDYKELVDDMTTFLSKHRLGDTLVKVFKMLLDGWNKPDIAEELGFKSVSRLSYYIVELQKQIKEYIIKYGDEGLARALAKSLGEVW